MTVESEGSPVDRPGRVFAVVGSDSFGPATRVGSEFTLTDLPPTRLAVTCEGFAGHYPTTVEVAVQEGAGAQRVAVQLRRMFEVPVKVLDASGTPLRESLGAGFPGFRRTPSVIATPSAPPRVLAAPPPADGGPYEAGSYRASKAPEFDGVLTCLAPPPLVASLVVGNTVLSSQPVLGAERELVFVVSPAELDQSLSGLSARVLDGPTGRPIDGSDSAGWSGFSVVPASQAGATALLPLDSSGTISVRGLPPGPVSLTVEVRGYATWRERVDLRPGVIHDIGPVRLWPSCCIEGRVVDEAGNPVEATVWVGTPRDDERGMTRGLGRSSNRSPSAPLDGWFTVCSLPRGELLVGVEGGPWAVNPAQVSASGALLEGVELVAHRGVGVELQIPEEGAGDAWMLIRSPQGAPVWSGLAPAEVRLLPGPYVATAGQGSVTRWTATFEVSESDTGVEFRPVD